MATLVTNPIYAVQDGTYTYQITNQAINDAAGYYTTTTVNGTAWIEATSNPLLTALEKDYQQIQHILDNKASVVL